MVTGVELQQLEANEPTQKVADFVLFFVFLTDTVCTKLGHVKTF